MKNLKKGQTVKTVTGTICRVLSVDGTTLTAHEIGRSQILDLHITKVFAVR